ncbi:hypothetical protein AB1Y20_013830 [Prymnesium parvum]|uniref:Cytidyltransferase-like domain-containing protein n=1 Tax=Prymnesium parvum TaxID=97485 RepID=A0AB34IH56_PRYPA
MPTAVLVTSLVLRLTLAAAHARGLRTSFPRVSMNGSHGGVVAGTAELQRLIDSIGSDAPPRVELTFSPSPPPANAEANASDEMIGVLDSSFNPPTTAHLAMMRMAAQQFGFARVLLLLAKQNADKPVIGASLAQRLQMMHLIAASDPRGATWCGITAHPLFVDKAAALRSLFGERARVFVLVGFDTWVRITDPKYYEAGALDKVLAQLFAAVDVVVTSREASNEEDAMSLQAQREHVERVAPKCNGRLHFMSNDPAMARLSSSLLRATMASGDLERAREILPECLHEFVISEGLYPSNAKSDDTSSVGHEVDP